MEIKDLLFEGNRVIDMNTEELQRCILFIYEENEYNKKRVYDMQKKLLEIEFDNIMHERGLR
jgi:hypothetical protein